MCSDDREGEFPSTMWSLVGHGLSDSTGRRNAALDQLVVRYLPPLRSHLVLRRRLDGELADELLQGFVTEKFVDGYLLQHADRAKGKFRSLLLRSLENYWIDWTRARAAQGGVGFSDVEDSVATPDAGADIFDVAWARQLLDEVLSVMKSDCDAAGQASVWGVFQCRLLSPVYENVEPLSYDEVCRRFGFTSPEQASNALITAKRKFQRAFGRVAAGYQHDGEESADILRDLIGILSRAGERDWRDIPKVCESAAQTPGRSHSELDDSQPGLIARVLDQPVDEEPIWSSDDLAGMMKHQLAQPLAGIAWRYLERRSPAGSSSELPLATLADVFGHPKPPLEILDEVKRYGRQGVHRPHSALPDEIASALYFGSIAAALVRHGRRISKSDDDLLRWGFERLLAQDWIGAPLRGLFEEGTTYLDARP